MRLLSEIRNYLGNYHVKSGVYHYYRNEFAQAIAFFRKALSDEATLSEGDRRNARNYLALSHKGQAQRAAAKGELEEAITELERASEVHPTYPDVHFMRARLLERVGRSAEAIEAYRRAIDRHPNYLEARIELGYCLLEAQRTEEALEAMERALAEKLARLERPFERGRQLLQAGQAEAALEQFHVVFRSVPALAETYLDEASEHHRMGEFDKALESLDRAVEFNPDYPDLENFRGIVLCELERFDDAVEAFGRSARLNPGHVVPRLNLAFAHLRAGQPREAEAELQWILQQEPTEPVALTKLEELRAGRAAEIKNSSGSARA
jgi:tetratricopeptide (TPR) repeat protein